MTSREENSPFKHMPPEPEGLPSPEDITNMQVEVWQAQEILKSAFLRKDRDLAVTAYRTISGDPEADLPEMYDTIKWRSREETDAPATPEQLAVANERAAIVRKLLSSPHPD